MAAFSENDFNKSDWGLLQNGSIILYWRPEVLDTDIAWLRNQDYVIDEFDCSGWRDEDTMHEALRVKLNFPDYYGANLNALNDVLSELAIPTKSGRAVVFRRFDAFTGRFAKVAWHVLDILDHNSQRAMLTSRRLVTLVQSDDPRIAFDAVGARPVMWNQKEWLDESRGV